MKKILSVLMARLCALPWQPAPAATTALLLLRTAISRSIPCELRLFPPGNPDEIITATEPLKEMLKTELAKEGYDVGNVEITVGTSYEAVGESLSAVQPM